MVDVILYILMLIFLFFLAVTFLILIDEAFFDGAIKDFLDEVLDRIGWD